MRVWESVGMLCTCSEYFYRVMDDGATDLWTVGPVCVGDVTAWVQAGPLK